MQTTETIVDSRLKWILPEQQLTEVEFHERIARAEKSNFSTVQDTMHKFEQWKESREKK